MAERPFDDVAAAVVLVVEAGRSWGAGGGAGGWAAGPSCSDCAAVYGFGSGIEGDCKGCEGGL